MIFLKIYSSYPMSVRTADVVAQAERARVFSLRDAFATPAAEHRIQLQPPQPAQTTAARVAPTLSLKFQTEKTAPAKAPTNLPAEVLKTLPATNPIVSKRPATTIPVAQPSSPAPVSKPASAPKRIYPATAESARADVMRLAAMVEDLQKKLSATQAKATNAERSAALGAQRAVSERAAASNKIHALGRELAISKDSEERARIELKTLHSTKIQLDTAALEKLENEKNVLAKKKNALESEIAQLEAKRHTTAEKMQGVNREGEALHLVKEKIVKEITDLRQQYDAVKLETSTLLEDAEKMRTAAREKIMLASDLEETANSRMEATRAAEMEAQRRLHALDGELKKKTTEQTSCDVLIEPYTMPEDLKATSGSLHMPTVPYTMPSQLVGEPLATSASPQEDNPAAERLKKYVEAIKKDVQTALLQNIKKNPKQMELPIWKSYRNLEESMSSVSV